MNSEDVPRSAEPNSTVERHSLPARVAARFVYLLPGVAAFLFVGHAYEDAGVRGAAPYAILIGLSILQAVHPTFLVWALLFAACVVYTLLVASAWPTEERGEWLSFLLIGLLPTLALWLIRPSLGKRRNAVKG